MLSEDSYLLEGLQSADKTKMHPKAIYKTHPLLPETEATLMFPQMTYTDAYINFISVTCSPHNAKITIGRYQHTNRPIPIIGKTADNRPIPIVGASLVNVLVNCLSCTISASVVTKRHALLGIGFADGQTN